MLNDSTPDTRQRTPIQEQAWNSLWTWLLRSDDEPAAAPLTGPDPDELAAPAEEGAAA